MSSQTKPVDNGTAAFVTALVTDLIIFTAVISAFVYFKGRKQYDWLYKSRLQPDTRKLNRAKPLDYDKYYGNTSRLSKYINWFKASVNISDDVLLETAGLDALLYNYFFLMCIIILGLFLIIAIGVILPINVTGENANTITGFAQLTMATIQNNSPRLAAHAACFTFLCVLVCYLSYRLYIHFLGLRRNYIKQAQLKGNELTLMIRDLPEQLCNTQSFTEFAQRQYGSNTVRSVYLPIDCDKLHDALEDRRDICDNLEHTLAQIEKDKQNGKQNKQYKKTIWSWKFWTIHKVDAVEYYENELRKYNGKVTELLAEAKTKQQGEMKVGFITLYSSVAYTQALTQEYLHYNKDSNTYEPMNKPVLTWKFWQYRHELKKLMGDSNILHIEKAPMPDDIYWTNIKLNKHMRHIRHIVITIALWALVFFWTIPIAAAAAVSTLPNLEALVPPITIVINVSPVVKGLIAGFLPSLALIIFQALLPTILLFMSKLEGIHSYSELQKSVFAKFYIFQFVNFYLITIFAGLLLNVIKQVISNPSIIPSLFGQSLPLVSQQFINYILITAFTSLPLLLLNIGGLIMGMYHRYSALTKRDLIKAKQPTLVSYGTTYPLHLLIFIICMGYAVIQPLIILFGLVYFIFAYVINRYNLLYSSTAQYETGGMYFPMNFNRMMAALILAELTLIGLFGVKESTGCSIYMIGPLVATISFTVYMNYKYGSDLETLNIQQAQEVDTKLKYMADHFNQQGYTDIYKTSSKFNPYIQCELTAPSVLLPFQNMQDYGLEQDVIQNLGDVGRGDIRSQIAERGTEFIKRDQYVIHKLDESNQQGAQQNEQYNNIADATRQTTPEQSYINDNKNYDIEAQQQQGNTTKQSDLHPLNDNSGYWENTKTYEPSNYNPNLVPDNFETLQQQAKQVDQSEIRNPNNFLTQQQNDRYNVQNNDSVQVSSNILQNTNIDQSVPMNEQQMKDVELGSNAVTDKKVAFENNFRLPSLWHMFASPVHHDHQLDDNNTPISNTEQKVIDVLKT